MKKTSRIYILLLSCFIAINTYSQSSSSISTPEYKESILSPQVELMNMYGNYPVDLANGLVNISIPLYEIKTPHLSLPINIKFHASGLKANEQEGLLGVRWLLDATYSVNRTVKGYPDDDAYEAPDFPFDHRVNNPYYVPDLSTLYGTTWQPGKFTGTRYAISPGILHKLSEYSGPASYFMDTEYDIFSYHLPSGKSGKFILRDSAGVKIPQLLPYEPIKIEIRRLYNDSGRFTKFTITDENGIAYSYATILPNSELWPGIYATDTWNLDAIISANKKDTIAFEYNFISSLRIRNRQVTARIIRDEIMSDYSIWDNTSERREPLDKFFEEEYNYDPGYTYINMPKTLDNHNNLSAIRFKGGSIRFNYESLYGSVFITSMDIYDTGTVPVKKIQFSYRQPDISGKEEDKAVLLDNLTIIDSQTGISNGDRYSFDYYNPERFPAGSTNTTDIQSDWWGYFHWRGHNLISEDITYNSLSLHSELMGYNDSKLTNYTVGESSFDKNSSIEDMKTCMIKSIRYPSGGRTIYDYDSNYYVSRIDFRPKSCGGLRIKSVENIAADEKSEIRTYQYNPHKLNPGCGDMPVYFYPPGSGGNTSKNFIEETTVDNQFMWLDPKGWYGPFHYSHYSSIYANYLYSNLLPGQFTTFHSNIVYYDKVVEYQGTQSENSGYMEYYYSTKLPEAGKYEHKYSARRINEYNSRQFIYVLPPKFGEGPNSLGKRIVYNKNGQPLEETIYDYADFSKGYLYDMPVKRLWNYKLGSCFYVYEDARDEELVRTDYTLYQQFAYLNQEYVLGASRLTKETTKTYTPEGIVITTKEVDYDPLHLLPVKETQTTSVNNDKLSKTYKYPYQYTQEPYIAMTKRNILSPVIETNILKNGNFQEKGITNYKNWFTDMYAPLNFQHQQQGGVLETRLLYDYNDQSQLRAAVKDGARKVVYISNAYFQPLAVIDQADYTEVETALGKTFIERLAKSFTVSDADMTTLHTLRSKLPNALVTIYTYKPLVGITSVTDPRGIKTTYEYDKSNRLEYIRDSEGNPVESYNYHFSNQ